MIDAKPLFTISEFNVKGIYVTGWVAGYKERINELIKLVDETIINSMVIDVKDQQGYLSYQSEVGLAKDINANKGKIKDVKGLLSKLRQKGIYTIARIVVFKDALLAEKRPDLALILWDSATNSMYHSKSWVAPNEKTVWDYNMELAREAAKMGFDEVQFDYIRYPALATSPTQAVLKKDKTKSQLINSFAAYVSRGLADLKIPISIDVFGLTTKVNDDLGIGQNFKELSEIIKIISPMIYPSHYSTGSYGVEIPAGSPFTIIQMSLRDAQEKLIDDQSVKIRPWLQDFSLEHQYTFKEVIEQIKATESLGIKEWLLWNPRSRYTKEALLPPE